MTTKLFSYFSLEFTAWKVENRKSEGNFVKTREYDFQRKVAKSTEKGEFVCFMAMSTWHVSTVNLRYLSSSTFPKLMVLHTSPPPQIVTLCFPHSVFCCCLVKSKRIQIPTRTLGPFVSAENRQLHTYCMSECSMPHNTVCTTEDLMLVAPNVLLLEENPRTYLLIAP